PKTIFMQTHALSLDPSLTHTLTASKHGWLCTHAHAHTRAHTRAHTHTHSHTHLLSSSRLSFEDGLGGLVVLVGHGAGEGRHALAVAQVEPDVRVRDEQLDDDGVLVADGHVDGRSALCVLHTAEEHKSSVRQGERILFYSIPFCATGQQLNYVK